MDTNGIHYIAVDFCDCDEKVSRRQQLLRENWYPATVHWPQTCATGRLLKQFHILTLTGKIPAYDYYNTLERLTDNTGVDVPKVSWQTKMLGTTTEVFDVRVPASLQGTNAHGATVSAFEAYEASGPRQYS